MVFLWAMITTALDIEQLKYPIGKFVRGSKADNPTRRAQCIAEIGSFPAALRSTLTNLTDTQLDTPYRPGGWTVRQLVHHLADSHAQTIIRFKLALTEEQPVIKPYKESLWAEQIDARTMPLDPSLAIIGGVHARWVVLMRAMQDHEWDRAFVHPEQNRAITLAEALELYVWHARHHLAHITGLKQRAGWS